MWEREIVRKCERNANSVQISIVENWFGNHLQCKLTFQLSIETLRATDRISKLYMNSLFRSHALRLQTDDVSFKPSTHSTHIHTNARARAHSHTM